MLNQETVDRVAGRRVWLSVEAMAALILCPWPDGERELRAALLQARHAAGGRAIELAHLPPAVRAALPDPLPEGLLEFVLTETERRYLEWAVAESRVPKKDVSTRLGVTRSALYKKLHRYQIPL